MLARLARVTAFRYTLLFALVFVASALTLFLLIYWSIEKSLQHHMAKSIQAQMTALAATHGAAELPELIAAVKRLSDTADGERVYLLLDRTGRKLAGNLHGAKVRDSWTTFAVAVNLPDAPLHDNEDRDTTPHKVLALGKTLSDGTFLLVGDDTDQVTDTEEAATQAFLWALIPTFAVGCAGGAFLSLNYLRRIDDITQTSREIVDGDLGRRIAVLGTNDEMDRLSINLNEMLERIQALMESLKQVSAGIAHDLRTPLSHLRQRLEAVRSEPQTTETYENAIDHSLAQVDDILATFSALLRIAQVESRTRRSAFAVQNLSDIFTNVAGAYAAVLADKGQVLVTQVDEGIRFLGDQNLLTQMVSNLIENAHQHTPNGARIEVSLTIARCGAIGVVADSGPGVPETERENVLKRFYRLDRSRSTPGNGLGLALVVAVAELHDIEIQLGDNEPGLRLSLRFPNARQEIAAMRDSKSSKRETHNPHVV